MHRTNILLALGVATSLSLTLVSATALAGPPPTPTGSPPAAPTGADILGGAFIWTDNSDNEDGFRIRIELTGDLGPDVTVLNYEVGPNVTSFPLPPEALIHCPDVTSITATVVAFNAFGESEGASASRTTLCPGPTFSPTATISAGSLPQTGISDEGGGSRLGVWLLAAAGGALLALSAVWYTRRRSARAGR